MCFGCIVLIQPRLCNACHIPTSLDTLYPAPSSMYPQHPHASAVSDLLGCLLSGHVLAHPATSLTYLVHPGTLIQCIQSTSTHIFGHLRISGHAHSEHIQHHLSNIRDITVSMDGAIPTGMYIHRVPFQHPTHICPYPTSQDILHPQCISGIKTCPCISCGASMTSGHARARDIRGGRYVPDTARMESGYPGFSQSDSTYRPEARPGCQVSNI